MTRRKLPPYGRRIATRRDAGNHPPRIWVLFGNDWQRRPEYAMCIKPQDYQPSVYDWSVCRGIPVHVIERTRVERPERDALRLAAEVAEFTAPVVFHWIASDDDWPDPAGKPAQSDAADLLRAHIDGNNIRLGWPDYWNEKKQRQYEQRMEVYRQALRASVKRKLNQLEAVS